MSGDRRRKCRRRHCSCMRRHCRARSPPPALVLPWPLPALLAWAAAWAASAHAARRLPGRRRWPWPLASALGRAGRRWQRRAAWRRLSWRWRLPAVSRAGRGGGRRAGLGLAAAAGLLLLPPTRCAPGATRRCSRRRPRALDGLAALSAAWRRRARARRRLRPGPRPARACARPGPRRASHGIEWSWPLALAGARCAAAVRAVRRGDMWAGAWAGLRPGLSLPAAREHGAGLGQGLRRDWRRAPGWSAWSSRCPAAPPRALPLRCRAAAGCWRWRVPGLNRGRQAADQP